MLPAAPPLVYFAARAGEAGRLWFVRRRATAPPAIRCGITVSLLFGLGICLLGGIRQAWADQDPSFSTDRERKATALLLMARRGGGRLLFGGREIYAVKDAKDIHIHIRRQIAEIYPSLRDVEITHGWGGFVNVGRIDVYGTPVKR